MTISSTRLRYLLVSGVCWLLWIVGIPALSAAGIHYAPATVIAFAAVAIIGFALHCRVTFQTDRTLRAFFRYNMAMLFNLPVVAVIIGIGHDIIGLPVFAATMLASALFFVWNYFVIGWAVAPPREGGSA